MALHRIVPDHPITGILPFDKLAIDAEIWHEAHQHHHLHRQLHAAMAHRPGIVWGLEVVATPAGNIAVAPGIAINDQGQTVVLWEPVALTPPNENGQMYVTLSFLRTLDSNSAVPVDGGTEHYRLVEGHELKLETELPPSAHLELASYFRSGVGSTIRNALNPLDPAEDELNLLHRRLAFPHCYGDITVGELWCVPVDKPAAWKPNRAGLVTLLREGNGRGFHLDFSAPLDLRENATPRSGERMPALLYMAGNQRFHPLEGLALERLRRFLGGGRLLFGEAENSGSAFAKSFHSLAASLGAHLRPVQKGDALLMAHHVFAAPPSGQQENGELFADFKAGVLFSTFNYGAAWQGDIAPADGGQAVDNATARERIRQAQEFGLNVLALAVDRRRRYELEHVMEGV